MPSLKHVSVQCEFNHELWYLGQGTMCQSDDRDKASLKDHLFSSRDSPGER